ncbi:ComEC/Rec2 family competence protein [Microbacterium sp. NPDC058389]|uniref:ComEC/Rec2 family competence protein n=1 Tax=Microbacterium sp. NPDC058389 TaxID=3346475 RepID=UPI0036622BAC
MLELDFLPVENEDGDSTRSGDAIAARFTHPTENRQVVIAVDAGFTDVGDQLADHIKKFYGTSHIDLVISTHPDTDHLNGIKTLLEACTVGELMIHLPWKHNSRAHEIGNYDRIVEVVNLAVSKSVTVTEPFAGTDRFGGAVTILGPALPYYESMLDEAVADAAGTSSASLSAGGFGHALLTKGAKVLERVRAAYPFETLDNIDDTGARNNMSVITLLRVAGERILLTGDAGIGALDQAIDAYEIVMGGRISTYPLDLLQAPHHGSRHNLGPAILDRILGTKGHPHNPNASALISSAKNSEKHPSPRVTNALGRRGASVYVTEGRTICHSSGISRAGWGPMDPVGPLEEE